MQSRGSPGRWLLGAVILLTAACSYSPFRFWAAYQATPQPAIPLERCDDYRDALCLVTFGLEPPAEMSIVLLTTAGLPAELELVVAHGADRQSYVCDAREEADTVLTCRGPQISLGTTVRIDVYTAEERVLLASGEFVLTAFALPTVPLDGIELPTLSATLTPRSTRTPSPSTAPPSPAATHQSAQTPDPEASPGITATPRAGATPTSTAGRVPTPNASPPRIPGGGPMP